MTEPVWMLKEWVKTYCNERDLAKRTTAFYMSIVEKFEAWANASLTLDEACRLLNDYVAWRSDQGSRYTAKTYRGALGVLLRAAERDGYCTMPRRVRPVKTPDLSPIGFLPEELEALMRFADPYQQAMLSLGFDTGLRHGNLESVIWSDVDETSLVIRIVQHKTGKSHVVPISAESVDLCVRLRPAAKTGDARLIPRPHKRSQFYRRWRALGKRAGVDVYRRCMQATRRTSATMIAKQHGAAAAAAFLGHSAASGLTVFLRFYRVGKLLDERPPAPNRPFGSAG